MEASTQASEEVRFCEKCFGAFDVPMGSRKSVCDECRTERRRSYNKGTFQPGPTPDPWMLACRRHGWSYGKIARRAGLPKTSIQRRFSRVAA